MLKKLTLTIVLFLSILCLGGCNMEEENRLMIEEVKEDKLIKINVTINNDLNGDFLILSTTEEEDIIIEANSVKNYELELFETEPIFLSMNREIVRFTHNGAAGDYYITLKNGNEIDSDMEIYGGYLFVSFDIKKWKEKHLKNNC